MKITLQPSVGNWLKGKARDVGALTGVFDEPAKLNPPDLAKFSDSRKLAALQELHAKVYDKDAVLRAMLFDLKSLDMVRVIENVDTSPASDKPEEVEE
jgi:hypothetical protein